MMLSTVIAVYVVRFDALFSGDGAAAAMTRPPLRFAGDADDDDEDDEDDGDDEYDDDDDDAGRALFRALSPALRRRLRLSWR
jgi:hypothetical protein